MRYAIDWRRLLDVGWWHWAATLPLLAAHVGFGEAARPAFEAATVLCAAMAALACWRTGNPLATAVQVRLAFLALLVLGLAPAAAWFHWLQLAGMSTMLAVGYCPLARLLELMPWNRDEPLTAQSVRATFLTRPACGGIVRPVSATPAYGPFVHCNDVSPCGITA